MTIKERRLHAGLTQTDVAVHLDINQSTVSRWEKGETKPVREYRARLAELYNCTVDELLDSLAHE